MGGRGFDLFIYFFDALQVRCSLGSEVELRKCIFSKYQVNYLVINIM
jgi:hypothetical protein